MAHARQLRTHVDQLAKKQYWNQFDPSPELVVAFVPGDPLLSAAYEHDPTPASSTPCRTGCSSPRPPP